MSLPSPSLQQQQQQITDIPPFDFHRFLDQMKDPSAAPIARYTKG